MIGNGGNIFCVSNAHCIECYFEGLTAIYRHILIICYLNARAGQNQRVKTLLFKLVHVCADLGDLILNRLPMVKYISGVDAALTFAPTRQAK